MRLSDLHISDETKKYYICFCPFHDDKNTPNLKVNKDNGRYYCWACGKGGVLTDLSEGIQIKTRRNVQPAPINWWSLNKLYTSSNGLYIKELASDLKVTTFALNLMDVGWRNDGWTFPVRNADLEIVGMMIRFRNGEKRMETGSSVGIYAPCYVSSNMKLWQDPLIICEGASDLAKILGFYHNAIGKFNCLTPHDIVQDFVASCATNKVLIIADNNKAGLDGASRLAKRLMGDNEVILTYPPDHDDIRKWLNEDFETAKGYIFQCLRRLMEKPIGTNIP